MAIFVHETHKTSTSFCISQHKTLLKDTLDSCTEEYSANTGQFTQINSFVGGF
jgi:hypothetical protein